MRASKHNFVHSAFDEVAHMPFDRLAPLRGFRTDEKALDEFHKVLGGLPEHLHSPGMSCDQVVEVGIADSVTSGHHRDNAAPRPQCRGFYRRHGAYDGQPGMRSADRAEGSLGGGVAGDD